MPRSCSRKKSKKRVPKKGCASNPYASEKAARKAQKGRSRPYYIDTCSMEIKQLGLADGCVETSCGTIKCDALAGRIQKLQREKKERDARVARRKERRERCRERRCSERIRRCSSGMTGMGGGAKKKKSKKKKSKKKKSKGKKKAKK